MTSEIILRWFGGDDKRRFGKPVLAIAIRINLSSSRTYLFVWRRTLWWTPGPRMNRFRLLASVLQDASLWALRAKAGAHRARLQRGTAGASKKLKLRMNQALRSAFCSRAIPSES